MHDDIERFLQTLEAERGFSANTIFAYRNDLGQFIAFCGTRRTARSRTSCRTNP